MYRRKPESPPLGRCQALLVLHTHLVSSELPGYKVTIKGVLSDLAQAQFPDVTSWAFDDNTHFFTPGLDQAALYGLIARIESLGLFLLAIYPVDLSEDARGSLLSSPESQGP